MGCSHSKRNKELLKRIAQYQIEAVNENRALSRKPRPFLGVEDCSEGVVSVQQFHNIFFDGFYCPYLRNPGYLLLIDVRNEEEYLMRHVATARWYGSITTEKNFDYRKFTVIAIYDQDGSSYSVPGTPARQFLDFLKQKKASPVTIAGGFMALAKEPYTLWTATNGSPYQGKPFVIHWYPSIVLDSCLYLGRADQALNPIIVKTMKITHIVCLTEVIPVGIFPFVSYFISPLCESKEKDLLKNLPGILKFIDNAKNSGGRILVHCEQGVNRGAAVVMAYLMHYKGCTLEDAYDYITGMKTIFLSTGTFLNQLSLYEEQLYGRKLTNPEDLW